MLLLPQQVVLDRVFFAVTMLGFGVDFASSNDEGFRCKVQCGES